MSSHSTVVYVEPNMIDHDWQPKDVSGKSTDDFERAPRLEDYCIAMNIEVEISSRDSQGSIKDGDKDVLILQWNNSKSEKVSFMGGTKMGGYNYNGLNITPRISGTSQNLTTYYADMYVGDLINYGTTEMIGIKSVNIEYAKSCVPVITVQFTDVRGLSLFQPTELSRDNTYNGIKGLNKDNVAQSFFQCFFKMPLPKFTIYIKGFYGNPVAYVCMCDKFDTNFNSDTGDFDVTARFIGYSYSFMTDVSFDALLAAPYSDFFGKKYWEDNKANGRFVIPDKLKTHDMPMPTLYEIHSDFKRLIQSSDSEMEKTTLTEEEKTHEQEIATLKEIRNKYQLWYEQLFNLLKVKYGKRYCFDFKENIQKDADWYRILILTNSKTEGEHDLSQQYTQYSNEFKKTNDDLYAAIEDFNASGNSYKALKNVSKDFSEYTRIKLFKDCYVNRNTRKIEFGGFSRENKLNRVQVVNRLFHSDVAANEISGDTASTEINAEWINKHGSTIKDYTLSTIYNDGIDQYKDAFLIEVDYSDLKRRINALVAHANKSDDEKEKEKARKEHNRIMLGKMNWYPSIENFTKIMMAHLETFMMMMYNVAESCSNRTPKKLKITVGKDGDACDVNENAKTVPPFPRVIKNEIGEDGITKTVDSWVGSYDNGEGFIEADMINGLFNAVEYIQELVKDEKEAEQVNTTEPVKPKPTVKHPLTSYDFHLTLNPYGNESDVVNDANAFAGKVAMRMFDILSISNFRKQYNTKITKTNAEFVKKLGTIEAENFYDAIKITNNNLLSMIGAKSDSGTIDSQAIINCVKFNMGIGSNENIPWQTTKSDDSLFDISFWLTRYTTSYSNLQKTFIYPMQDMSFNSLEESLKIFNKGANSIQANNNNIIVNWIEANSNVMSLLKSSNNSCFGSVFISDDYKVVSDELDMANSSSDNVYKDVYDMIHTDSVFNGDRFKEMVLTSGVFRPKIGVNTVNKKCTFKIQSNLDALYIHKNKETNEMQSSGGEEISYVFDRSKLNGYTADIENGNITSWFLTECRGFEKVMGMFAPSYNRSLFTQEGYKDEIDAVNWGFGGLADKRIGFFLMGLDAIDYTSVAKHLNTNETFTYLPKLAVLQIGAALASMENIKEEISIVTLSKKIVLPKSFDKIINYLNRINYTTRIAYIKYFKNWVLVNNAEINKNLINANSQIACFYEIDNYKRALFREDSEYISSLSNNIMNAVLVTKGNVNHYRAITREGLEIDDYVATNFLDGFLGRLRELYSIGEEDKGGDSVKLAKSPSKTTEDMKKELYRYLKLVYDKWVPATDKESWKFESFFNIEAEDKIRDKKGCDGHLFHFIDSFYNKIGDKLLVNPRLLSDKINAALQAKDVNTMMLGFMADIFSQNKCMLMCLQNFIDLSEKGAMEAMFKPIPYNDMPKPHKHPDFVVVYPYEPSKYLNVDNGEFNNDSFMLNDEFDTPLAVKSRTLDDKTCYPIPAFGVSYGKQYQSYFRKVSVGMANPIATQQSIMAKHAILRASQDTATKSTVAQDMYDIYATQSYTCKVEMMGCAWVQPLMYFVLTNVPMFRGSYLILKVNHKITPGNMITEFTGTRMANVSNKLVEDIFTDEDIDIAGTPYLEYKKNEKADVDNDCPYKIFPLFEETNDIEIGGNGIEKGVGIMKELVENHGFSEYAAAGIVGNMSVESYNASTQTYFDPYVYNKNTKKMLVIGLVQWNDNDWLVHDMINNDVANYGYDPDLKKKLYNEKYKRAEADTIINQMKSQNKGLQYQIKFLADTIKIDRNKKLQTALENASSPSDAADAFRSMYERNNDLIQKRRDSAKKYYDAYKSTSKTKKSEPDKNVTEDIYEAFFKAVQKSLNTTNKACELSKEMYIEKSQFSDGIMMIKQKGGGTDKLPLVFDIILNGYYQYVQKLWWVYPTNGLKDNPLHIDVCIVQNPKPNERLVLAAETKKINEAKGMKFGSDATSVNEKFLKSILKKYQKVPNTEIPQFDNQDIFKSISIQNCNSVGTTTDDGRTKAQSGSQISPGDAGSIDGWNVGKACAYIIDKEVGCKKLSNGKTKCGHSKCASHVEDAIAAGGGPLTTRMQCGGATGAATNLRYRGILEKNGFVKIDEGTVAGSSNPSIKLQAGDVAILGGDYENTRSGKYHACMYTASRGWVSDFIQRNMNAYGSAQPYAIYRFHNKTKS